MYNVDKYIVSSSDQEMINRMRHSRQVFPVIVWKCREKKTKCVLLSESEAVQMEVMGSSGHSTTVVYVTVAGLGLFLALVAALAALNHSHHNKMYGNRCVYTHAYVCVSSVYLMYT